jgi:DMSO/TMAO reductase YedYZ molybdopterin-dependent catalytic subunit
MRARPPAERIATLDCTDGWYTTQRWRGIPLAELPTEAGAPENAIGVILRAASAAAYLTLPEARDTLLATHCGDQVFDHRHGYPLRAVVPARRGWQWVKWLVEVI